MFTARLRVRLVIAVVLMLLSLIIISLFTTSPDELGPYGITVWFIVLFFTLSGAIAALLYGYRRVAHPKLDRNQRLKDSMRQGALLSVWLSSLLALNSLKQLSMRDVLLISLLLVLVEFYMRRAR